MEGKARHPDDEQLFDFIEEQLDPSQMQAVEQHLEHCHACVAFLESTRVGAELVSELVEPMSSAQEASLDDAVAKAWRDRIKRIEKEESRQDIAAAAKPTTNSGPDEALNLEKIEPFEQRHQARYRRRGWTAIIAFSLLALLAGVSLNLSERPSSESHALLSPSASEADSSARSADASTKLNGIAESAVAGAPPSTSDGELEQRCVAVRDLAELYLPDGRTPTKVYEAPLGIYVACG